MKVLFLANKYMTLGDALFKVVGKYERLDLCLGNRTNVSPDFSHMMHVSEVGGLVHAYV